MLSFVKMDNGNFLWQIFVDFGYLEMRNSLACPEVTA